MSDNGEAQKPNPDRPRQPENAASKPTEGQKPQDVTGTQRAVDALNITTPGKPDRPDLVNLANAGQGPETNVLSGTPAEGMDLDYRYQIIRYELRQKWLAEHPGQDFLTEEGQNYNLGYMNPNDRDRPTLKSDTESWFRRQYPEDAKAYDKKEETRVYEDPNKDPLIIKTDHEILRATNLDSQVMKAMNANSTKGYDSWSNVWGRVNSAKTMQAWDSFVNLYPEKARAYADKGHVQLRREFEFRERRKQEQEQRQRGESSSRPITNEQTTSNTTANDEEQSREDPNNGKEKQNDYDFARLADRVFSRYMDAGNPVIRNNVTSEMQNSLSALAFEARKGEATPENVAPAMAFLLQKMADTNPDYVDPVMVSAYENQGMDYKDVYRDARELFMTAGKKLWPDVQAPPDVGYTVRLRNAVLSLRNEDETPGLFDAAANYWGKGDSPLYNKDSTANDKRYAFTRLMNSIGNTFDIYFMDVFEGRDPVSITNEKAASVVRSAYIIELHKQRLDQQAPTKS